ncbi:MAG TPA: DUF1353 domain-containing protein [Chthoniobacterales bacterium]|nr:DUF1353 domain-containing protein [Chthoniobacterales bacterium]
MRALLVIFIAFVLSGCVGDKVPAWVRGASKSSNKWGHYSGYVEARWENDGRSMTLLSELRYTDPNGVVWIAPAGSEVDGASIPRTLWSLMGGPFEGKYRNASVLHDVAYDEKNRPHEVCDRMFYNAMRCSGVGAVEAGTMYYALRKFGHHWKAPKATPVKVGEDIVARAEPVNQTDINATRDWIRSSAPNMQQIEQRADAGPDGSH